MRVIVLDEDGREPITIVEIPLHLMRKVMDGELRNIRLPLPWAYTASFRPKELLEPMPPHRCVTLSFRPVHCDKEIMYWTAIPDDPELALLLRASFLPGQLSEVQRRERVAWFEGAFNMAVRR